MNSYPNSNPDNMSSECHIVNKDNSETSYTCTDIDKQNNKRTIKYKILNKNDDLLINWKPYFDKEMKSWYWYNSKTGEAKWNKPDGFLNVDGIVGGMRKSKKYRKYRRSKKSKKLHSLNRSYKLSNQRRRVYRRRVSK